VFVVEQRAEKQESRKLAGELPVMDRSGSSQKPKQDMPPENTIGTG